MHFWHTSEMKNVFERNFSPVKFGHVSMRPIFELMTCCAIVQWVNTLSERKFLLSPVIFGLYVVDEKNFRGCEPGQNAFSPKVPPGAHF